MANKATLKVCFLAGTLGAGGAERQLVYSLRALRGAGVSARVLCLTRGEHFEREILDLGVGVEHVGASGSRPRRLAAIVRALRRERCDILQAGHFYTNLYVAAASRILGLRGIGAIRGDLSMDLAENGVMGQAHLRAPSHLIANSATARDRAIARGIRPDKIDLIKNAVDVELFRRARAAGEGSHLNILFVGRLTPEKRPDRFLRVVSEVIKRHPRQPIRAKVAGNGPLRPRLMVLAQELGLGPDQLEFLGEQRRMDEVYGSADLLLLTSDSEGTPNVILEAMAHGIPVAATRVGGVADIVGEAGLTVERDDEDGLTAAALRLTSDPGLRESMGRKGAGYVADFHSLGALRDGLIDVYMRVLRK